MYGNNEKYIGLKKSLAFVAAIGLWGVSMFFSYNGFSFDATSIKWFGVVLALVVTVVELVFNTKIAKLNPTLLVAGIICYFYGIYTNVTGFYVLQHGSLAGFFTGMNWLIPVFSGVIAEVLPEALFAWSIGAFNEGDLIGNIGEMFTGSGNSPKTVVQDSVKNYAGNRGEQRIPNHQIMQNLPHSRPEERSEQRPQSQQRTEERPHSRPTPRTEPLSDGGFHPIS